MAIDMEELEHLLSMWNRKIRRSTKLIIPEVTWADMTGSLNNEHWVFVVPYAFRSALDIKYETRRKNKTPYKIWTQGPVLDFTEGDVLNSKDKTRSIQVQSAARMGWDPALNVMYKGRVVFKEIGPNEDTYENGETHSCSQMQFLELLIFGEYGDRWVEDT